MENRLARNARHLAVVAGYYETNDERPLEPMLQELRTQALDYLRYTLGLRDAEQAEDITQDTLAEVLRYLRARRFDMRRPLAILLCIICRSRFLDYKKWGQRKPSAPGTEEDPYLLLPASTATPAQGLPTAEVQQAAAATLTAATQAVLSLDANARAAVVLYYYHGLPAPTAAAQLGIAEGTFRTRLNRGLTALQAWGRTVARPAAEVYAALPGLDTGDLFREPLRLAG